MRHFASIIHLTDLHLFVDPDGRARSIRERRLVERVGIWTVGRFHSGFATADGTVFNQLLELLPEVISIEQGEGASVVVVQTGDVEAFGYLPPYGLAGYALLHGTLWPQLAKQGAKCIDIYGNHDIWPGFPPLLPSLPHDASRVMQLQAFQGSWDTPIDVEARSSSDITLRFHRVNSIITDRFFAGVLARGGVGPHPPDTPYDRGNIATVVERVAAASHPVSRPTLNILLIHHPPHVFRPRSGTEWTTGYLDGRVALSSLTPSNVQLVIAGHRHELDPLLARDVISPTQSPINSGAAQLVAESPTLLVRRSSSNSLALYRLHSSDDAATVDVERLLFRYSDVTGLSRVPDPDPIYVSGVRTTKEA